MQSVVVLCAGAMLTWSTWRFANYQPSQQWGQWVAVHVVNDFIMPLLIVTILFTASPKEFGLQLGDGRTSWRWGLGLFGLFVIVLLILPFLPFYAEIQARYRAQWLPAVNGWGDLLWLQATTLIYMFCWEYFFRGFLLFGMAKGFGVVASVLLQSILFGLAHWNKPSAEMSLAFAGGALLGAVCWRCQSFLPGFIAHGLGHAAFNLLVLYR
jgi:membrane protease YdiL (CAAX protease family)